MYCTFFWWLQNWQNLGMAVFFCGPSTVVLWVLYLKNLWIRICHPSWEDSCLTIGGFAISPKTNKWLAGKTPMNEDVSPIKNCDFPASHVSFRESISPNYTITPCFHVYHTCLPQSWIISTTLQFLKQSQPYPKKIFLKPQSKQPEIHKNYNNFFSPPFSRNNHTSYNLLQLQLESFTILNPKFLPSTFLKLSLGSKNIIPVARGEFPGNSLAQNISNSTWHTGVSVSDVGGWMIGWLLKK